MDEEKGKVEQTVFYGLFSLHRSGKATYEKDR